MYHGRDILLSIWLDNDELGVFIITIEEGKREDSTQIDKGKKLRDIPKLVKKKRSFRKI